MKERKILTNSQIIEQLRAALPKSKTADKKISENIEYYENAINTVPVFSKEEISLRVFIDLLSKNQPVERINDTCSRFKQVYERILDISINGDGFIFKGMKVGVENIDGLSGFKGTTSSTVPLRVQLSKFPELNPMIVDEFERMISEAYDAGMAINFNNYFLIMLRNGTPLLVNVPAMQLEMTVNEIKSN